MRLRRAAARSHIVAQRHPCAFLHRRHRAPPDARAPRGRRRLTADGHRPGAQAPPPRSPQLQAIDLSSVNSSIPWWPHSLPTPLCLNPPNTPVIPTPLGCSADQPGPEAPNVSALLVGDPTVCTATLPARI